MKQFLKRRWKEILASSVMIISASILTFQLIVSPKKTEIKSDEISNMGEYYKNFDEESQAHIRNNIFSVTYYPKSAQGRESTIYGTCWSFYHDDNFWYLMTNFHVVEDIQEQAFWKSYNPASGSARQQRPGHTLHDPKTNEIVGREVYYNDLMKFKSDVDKDNQINIVANHANIIYTQLNEIKGANQDAKRIFADVDAKSYKRFQVDMALIKVSYDALTIWKETRLEQTISLEPVSWIGQNTYNFEKEYDRLKDHLPVKLDGDGNHQPIYYTAGYPSPAGTGQTFFIDGILAGKKTKKAQSLTYASVFPVTIRRASNSWRTILPFVENAANSDDPKGWKMSGGSSGSPLLEVGQDQKSGRYYLKQKTPIAIYWGGTGLWNGSTMMFYPTYDLFYNDQSDADVMAYNILQNCHSFLQSPETSSDALN